MSIDVKRLKTLKSRMSEEQKRKLLIGLRRMREEYTGNVGGETDIVNPDRFMDENEFTSGDSRPEPKVISKTFDTNTDFDSYVNQRRGIEITPKEQQALVTELAPNPSVQTAPQQAQPQAQPKVQPPSPPQAQPQTKPNPSNNTNGDEEKTVDDTVRVQKSITFVNETDGAMILQKFLAELELANERPISRDRFFMKYEITDEFGKNATTVIKKLKEGNQFCWTAFSKYESAEDEGQPNKGEDEGEEEGEDEGEEV